MGILLLGCFVRIYTKPYISIYICLWVCVLVYLVAIRESRSLSMAIVDASGKDPFIYLCDSVYIYVRCIVPRGNGIRLVRR